MGEDVYEVQVVIRVDERYLYNTKAEKEFAVLAPMDILRKLDITGSVYNLYFDALDAAEEEGDD